MRRITTGHSSVSHLSTTRNRESARSQENKNRDSCRPPAVTSSDGGDLMLKKSTDGEWTESLRGCEPHPKCRDSFRDAGRESGEQDGGICPSRCYAPCDSAGIRRAMFDVRVLSARRRERSVCKTHSRSKTTRHKTAAPRYARCRCFGEPAAVKSEQRKVRGTSDKRLYTMVIFHPSGSSHMVTEFTSISKTCLLKCSS